MLLLVSALFMAAWTGDQRAISEAWARRDAARQNLLAARSAARSADLSAQPVHTAVPTNRISNRISLPASNLVPLPRGIAPGQYLAVSHSGATQPVTVPHSLNNPATTAAPRDFYLVDDDAGQRWYLVRIDRPSAY